MVTGYRGGGCNIAISRSLLVVLVLLSESSSLHVAPRHGSVSIKYTGVLLMHLSTCC